MKHHGTAPGQLLFAFLLGFTPVGAACGDDGFGGRPPGVPGSSDVPPQCGVMSQACLGQRNDAPLAQGSVTEFTIDFQGAGQAGLDVSLTATEPDVLQADDWVIEAVGTGVSGLMFTTPDGSVIDFVHVRVRPAEELRILAWSETGELLGRVLSQVTLLVGDEVLISVEPFENAQPLLGNFSLGRTIVGDAIEIIPDAVGGLHRVVARREGQVTITFDALGLESLWEIEVLP